MISGIFSAAVLLLLSFGGVADATHRTQRHKQHQLKAYDELSEKTNFYTSCRDLFLVNYLFNKKSCEQCVTTKTGWWLGSKKPCVFKFGTGCRESSDERNRANHWLDDVTSCRRVSTAIDDECQRFKSGKNGGCNNCLSTVGKAAARGQNFCVWKPDAALGQSDCRAKWVQPKWRSDKKYCDKKEKTARAAFGHARKATKLLSTNRDQHANKKLAPVDPSMQAYNHRHTLSQEEFQSLSGNSGYCWRYSAAQCLGMPYLVFEHMVKAMQAHIKKLNKEKDFPYLTLPLSDVKVTKRLGGHDGGAQDDMIKYIKRFVDTYDSQTAPIWPKTPGQSPLSGVVDVKVMDTKLRHLIQCVDEPDMQLLGKPSMTSIENFLKEKPAWRRVMVHMNGGVGDLEEGHQGALLWNDNQLYWADGNNYYKLDGEMVPFKDKVPGVEFFKDFKKRIDDDKNEDWYNIHDVFISFVKRDRCAPSK